MATKKVDRTTLLVVMFCPGCQTQAPRVDRDQETLCAPCHRRFSRWAGERMRDPAAQRTALATWIRLKYLGCLP